MSAVLDKTTSDENFYSAPTIAIEIVSPDDTAEEMMDKILFYLKNGSRLVWVISPQTNSVTVYRPDNTGKVLRKNDVIEGEDALPNFQLPVAALFANLPKE